MTSSKGLGYQKNRRKLFSFLKLYDTCSHPKPGRSLDPEIAGKFCCNDSVNRVIPGQKNYVAGKTGGIKNTNNINKY